MSNFRRSATLALLFFAILLLVQAQTLFQVGYALLTPDPGSPAPFAAQLLRTINAGGVLVGEACIPAVAPTRAGLIYVDESETQNAVAFVNPFEKPATVVLLLRDSAGTMLAQQPLFLAPYQQQGKFISELFGAVATNVRGSVTFQSDQPIGLAEFRQNFNARREPTYSAVPLVDLGTNSSQPAIVPYVRSGDGFVTEVILLNRSGQRAAGRLQFRGNALPDSPYDIPANGVQRVDIPPSLTPTGYVEVSPELGSDIPAVMAIVQWKSVAGLISETVVPQVPVTRTSRVLVESIGMQTAINLANPNLQSTDITFTLLDRSGTIVSSVAQTLPAQGFFSSPSDLLFSGVSSGFVGQIEIQSVAPVSAVAVRSITNSRNDLILGNVPAADLTLAPATTLVLPQVVLGGGFSTRVVFINRNNQVAIAGSMDFRQSDGTLMNTQMPNPKDAAGRYQITARGSRQLFPGNPATVETVSLRDPLSNKVSTEVTINVDQATRPSVVAIDSSGTARDDLAVSPAVTNSEVASVDPETGIIRGVRAGFSTLSIAVGGKQLQNLAVTVVTVESSGVRGYSGPKGIAASSGNALYLAASDDQTILFSPDFRQALTPWAGVLRSPGYRDDVRLASLFRNPSYLARRSDDTLYVSDSDNHVIREIPPESDRIVRTIAGNAGVPGAQDGTGGSATFRNPQGLDLDDRGYLWVADAGNHTIRRINAITQEVTTMAGQAGMSGFADGLGTAARFSSPTGIVFEPISYAQQLVLQKNKQRRPVSMIIADTGNRVVRRIFEDGRVETIAQTTPFGLSAQESPGAFTFDNPIGVTVDAAGTIFVVEAGDVHAILTNGSVVRAAQAGTVTQPTGITIKYSGELVISDKDGPRQVRYGAPLIKSVTPERISNRGGVPITITGENFAPETIVVLAGTVISNRTLVNTETITFVAPPLDSGRTTLTVQNRGGIAQRDFLIDPIPLEQLPRGSITTIAGGSTFTGDGGFATQASIGFPEYTAVDAAGNIYITDTDNNRIRRVDRATKTIITIAGTGRTGCTEEGLALAASFTRPAGIAVDVSGNVFISDTGNNRIRKVDVATGVISTVLGSRCDRSVVSANLNSPRGLASDASGNLYVADSLGYRILMLTRQGVATPVAGTGEPGTSAAQLNYPNAVAVDPGGNLWIADTNNNRVRRVNAVTRVIENVEAGDLLRPAGVAVGTQGDVFISDTGHHRILRVDASGTISTIAGTTAPGAPIEGVNPTDSPLNEPTGIAVNGSGILVIADRANNRIREIAPSETAALTPTITTIAGDGQPQYLGDNGLAIFASFKDPLSVVSDAEGNLFIADTGNNRVRRVDHSTGIITTFAGTGAVGHGGDEGPGIKASLNFPSGLAVDSLGSLYIADTDNQKVRKVGPDGIIRTVADSSSLSFPSGLTIDSQNNLYIADTGHHLIRKLTATSGSIEIVAGNGRQGSPDNPNDGRLATEASLNQPTSIAIDGAGNLYIADTGNRRIRRVDFQTRIISTILSAGGLFNPTSVAIYASGNLLILDAGNHRLFQLQLGVAAGPTVIAGTGVAGFSGENGPATLAMLWLPFHVAIDRRGNILIADTANQRIRGIVANTP